MSDELEKLAETFPRYLTPSQQRDLTSELDRFPAINYYGKVDEELMQGDVWGNLEGLVYTSKGPTNARRSWMIISNTCDVSAENRRYTPPSIAFAPVVPLEKYLDLMRMSGASEETIASYAADLRRQLLTGIFYLPPGAGLAEESVVVMDSIQSKPLAIFNGDPEKTRSAQLSQAAFWVLLIKLSIHFCRAFESVDRSSGAKG